MATLPVAPIPFDGETAKRLAGLATKAAHQAVQMARELKAHAKRTREKVARPLVIYYARRCTR